MKTKKKLSQKIFFLGPIFLSKNVHMMFLHVLEVFLGRFSNCSLNEYVFFGVSAGPKSRFFLIDRVFWRCEAKSVAYYLYNRHAGWAYQVVLRRNWGGRGA